MNNFFSPAIRLMNRLSYTKKFALLWFMALNVTVVLLLSILFLVNKEISIAKQEIKGIDLITSILHTQQSIQLHRGLGALSIVGNTAAHNRHADVDAAINENIAKLGEMLPVNLRESNDWIKIKAGWGHLHEEQFRSDVAGYLSRSTRLIYDLMAFTQTVAHEYHLSLDSEASTYTLIDTAVTKLPAAIEHIGQLRGYGAVMLAEKRVTEEQKIQAYKSLGMLADALEMFELNVERTANYNPVLKQSLFSINNAIANITRQVVGTMESEILVGNFARDPEEFFELFTHTLDSGYQQIYDNLIPLAKTILKERIAQKTNALYINTGFAVLLMLVVGYLAAGIYFSIANNVRSLAQSAGKLASGDLSVRTHFDTRDELGQIGKNFNEVAESFGNMLAAQKRIEDSMKMMVDVLNASPDFIAMANPDGYITYMNQAGRQILGIGTEEEIGFRIAASHPKWAADMILNQGLPAAALYGIWQGETALLSHDQQEIPVHQVILAHKSSSGEVDYFSTIMRDISAIKWREKELQEVNATLSNLNKKLEESYNQLMQSEKMASIGQLAAGVAHEINNPIGYVYSNLSSLEKYMQDAIAMIEHYETVEKLITDERMGAHLKTVREKLDIDFLKEDLKALMNESRDGITRVKNIVQNLKDFSHVDAGEEWHYSDLRKGLDSTLNIVHNEIKYKADVVKEYGELPEVECLSSQLNQVFMNLLVNAAHAIEERGTITIRTGQQGEKVWVEVADTGKGIKPEHLTKIFDPFFTTKPVGKGTGLGLSLSYSIVQKHHGRIEVESEVGKGTTFRVWLPVKQPVQENGGQSDGFKKAATTE